MHLCVHVEGRGLHQVSFLVNLHLVILCDRVSHWICNLLSHLNWLARKLRDSFYFHLPNLWTPGMAFTWMLKLWAQVFKFTHQTVWRVSQLPSSTFCFFNMSFYYCYYLQFHTKTTYILTTLTFHFLTTSVHFPWSIPISPYMFVCFLTQHDQPGLCVWPWLQTILLEPWWAYNWIWWFPHLPNIVDPNSSEVKWSALWVPFPSLTCVARVGLVCSADNYS